MNRSVLPPPRRFAASRFEANLPTPPGRFERWGRGCARRGKTVVAVWLLLVVVAVGADRTWGGTFTDSFELPGSDAQAGADLLADQQAGVRGIAGQLVFHSPQAVLADNRQAIDATVTAVANLPGVVTVSDPFAVPAGAVPGGTATPRSSDAGRRCSVSRACWCSGCWRFPPPRCGWPTSMPGQTP